MIITTHAYDRMYTRFGWDRRTARLRVEDAEKKGIREDEKIYHMGVIYVVEKRHGDDLLLVTVWEEQ